MARQQRHIRQPCEAAQASAGEQRARAAAAWPLKCAWRRQWAAAWHMWIAGAAACGMAAFLAASRSTAEQRTAAAAIDGRCLARRHSGRCPAPCSAAWRRAAAGLNHPTARQQAASSRHRGPQQRSTQHAGAQQTPACSPASAPARRELTQRPAPRRSRARRHLPNHAVHAPSHAVLDPCTHPSAACVLSALCPAQEADLVRLKREAKSKNGFYVEPEAKLVFVVSKTNSSHNAIQS